MDNKEQHLLTLIKQHGSVLVAYSGGVDSNYLLYTTSKANIRLKAVTFSSSLYPASEVERAINNAKTFGVEHQIINIDPLEIDEVKRNMLERCYVCKKFLFSTLVDIAQSEGYDYIYDGSNLDDLDDYRPGMKACKELNIISPMILAKMTKNDIRQLSKNANLNTWNQPSFACYLSRFKYDTNITHDMIAKVRLAETSLHDIGIASARVRYHDETARIEMSNYDFNKYITDDDKRIEISKLVKSVGFTYVAVDLEEYKTGSMNKTIENSLKS